MRIPWFVQQPKWIASVKIRQVHFGKEMHPYAMLDCYSQGIFINTDLWKKLKAPVIKTTIKIKILNGEDNHWFKNIKIYWQNSLDWSSSEIHQKRLAIRRWRCCNSKQNQGMEILGEDCWRNYPDLKC